MMELLDRYLAAVRRNLPADEAADITEELRDVLLARAEEREAVSGDANWSQLLKEFGHPLVIAARYRKHQWLIGPEIYPFYVHFMKVVALIVLAVTVVLATFKAAFGGGDIGALAAGLLGSLWWAAVASVGSVTILFALSVTAVPSGISGTGTPSNCRMSRPSSRGRGNQHSKSA
jgi:hypothetical protein